jgi:hypothetical protein
MGERLWSLTAMEVAPCDVESNRSFGAVAQLHSLLGEGDQLSIDPAQPRSRHRNPDTADQTRALARS